MPSAVRAGTIGHGAVWCICDLDHGRQNVRRSLWLQKPRTLLQRVSGLTACGPLSAPNSPQVYTFDTCSSATDTVMHVDGVEHDQDACRDQGRNYGERVSVSLVAGQGKLDTLFRL